MSSLFAALMAMSIYWNLCEPLQDGWPHDLQVFSIGAMIVCYVRSVQLEGLK